MSCVGLFMTEEKPKQTAPPLTHITIYYIQVHGKSSEVNEVKIDITL